MPPRHRARPAAIGLTEPPSAAIVGTLVAAQTIGLVLRSLHFVLLGAAIGKEAQPWDAQVEPYLLVTAIGITIRLAVLAATLRAGRRQRQSTFLLAWVGLAAVAVEAAALRLVAPSIASPVIAGVALLGLLHAALLGDLHNRRVTRPTAEAQAENGIGRAPSTRRQAD